MYKAGLGSGTCVGCPSNSTSPAGSIIQIDCQCNAGLTQSATIVTDVNFARVCGGASDAACSATQSSYYNPNNFISAFIAVDGSTGAHFHTQCSSNQWWRVDFGQEKHIELVRINHRASNERGRIETPTIRVGTTYICESNAMCATITGFHHIYSVTCNAIGRCLLET